jgi:hypothetical protein
MRIRLQKNNLCIFPPPFISIPKVMCFLTIPPFECAFEPSPPFKCVFEPSPSSSAPSSPHHPFECAFEPSPLFLVRLRALTFF